MVKLDNWETKAEKAADRRVKSKQLKNKKQQTRHHKALAQQFLSFLQEHNDAIIRSTMEPEIEMHIWTDVKNAQSSSTEDIADISENGTNKIKGRPRSNSHSIHSTPNKTKGRPRSNSEAAIYSASSSNQTKGKQKGRLRSGSNTSESVDFGESSDAANAAIPHLCQSYFFGSCSATLVTNVGGGNGSRRKNESFIANNHGSQCANGWHSLHSSSNDNEYKVSDKKSSPAKTKRKTRPNSTTLTSILLGKHQKKGNSQTLNRNRLEANSTVLHASSVSAASHFAISGDAGMDMLRHHSVCVSCRDDDDDDTVQRLGETLTSNLSQNNCPIGSITYVVIKDMLVFDRYRDGIVLSDAEQELLLFGGSKRRSISAGECGEHRSRSGSMEQESGLAGKMMYHSTDDTLENIHHNLHHQHLVQYLPGQVLEFILRYLPTSATAVFPQVCKSWNSEIGRSSPDLWRHLLARYQWPCPPAEEEKTVQGVSSAEDNTAVHRSSFISHYQAKRDLEALKVGLEQLSRRSSDNVASFTSSKDVAQFDFRDTIGPPITGSTFLQMWSDTRILVGSGDCTLHLYDVIDDSTGTGKRCKQSVRVKVPFANSRRRPYFLTACKLDNDTVGCMIASEDDDVWIVVVQRDELLCAGKGGNHIEQLDEDTVDTFNLQSIVLKYLALSNDSELVDWLRYRGVRHDGVMDTADLTVIVAKDHLVACGGGNFLIEICLLFSNLFDEMETFRKVILFSSSLGKIMWISPRKSESGYFSLVGLDQRLSLGGLDAAFVSSGSEAVGISVEGPRKVECSVFAIPASNRSAQRIHLTVTPLELLLFEDYVEEGGLQDDGGRTTAKVKRILHLFEQNDKSACIVDCSWLADVDFQIILLREQYVLVLSYEPSSCWSHYDCVARILHMSSRRVIYQVRIDYPISDRLHPLSFACAGGPMAGSATDSGGMFVAGHDVSYTHNDTWTNKKSKKKNWKRGKSKKDGFCRGMRQSMG